MDKRTLFVCLCTLATALGKPATTNDQLDKVTVNDVAANAVVSPDKKADLVDATGDKKDTAATVQITGITTGADLPVDPPGTIDFKPQRTGSMFARFIDDIFQIPINILQNVSRLITSPFVQAKKTPEVTAPAAAS